MQELNITAAEYDNIISRIYDMTAEEMIYLAKAIKSGSKVLPADRMAFERVLNMRQVERQEAYNIYYSDINAMCHSCKKYGNECKGTTCKTWTGCVFGEA